ncbi:MAG: 2-amino-4-hydroxy-6-hydroxymethyldihydropteridine diphosphokinase [Burkholderiales bacterium]|nr:MAG: 2-amino-4-hydroxy-6-hydroxymethyldihydropteridine diphosphokinase [Burkholderiales bacterium]
MTAQRAYIGLGANEGDVVATLNAAIEALRSLQQCEFVGLSPFYRTAPIEAEGPDYTNAVVAIDTVMEPYALLLALLDIELRLGRKRRGADARLKSSRRVDLDLLLHGPLLMRSTPLTLPHPRMHERAFVLRPLLDLAPDLELPGHGPAARLLGALMHQRVERVDPED